MNVEEQVRNSRQKPGLISLPVWLAMPFVLHLLLSLGLFVCWRVVDETAFAYCMALFAVLTTLLLIVWTDWTKRWLTQIVLHFQSASQATIQAGVEQPSQHLPLLELQMMVQSFNQVAQHWRRSLEEIEVALQTTREKFTKIFHSSPDSIMMAVLSKHLQVQFVYQESVQIQPGSQPSIQPRSQLSTGLKIETLITPLPTEWLTSFHQAVLEGDLDWMLSLLEAIGNNEEVVAYLLNLVRNFQYAELLNLVQLSIATRQQD
jgi:hypothetical protein